MFASSVLQPTYAPVAVVRSSSARQLLHHPLLVQQALPIDLIGTSLFLRGGRDPSLAVFFMFSASVCSPEQRCELLQEKMDDACEWYCSDMVGLQYPTCESTENLWVECREPDAPPTPPQKMKGPKARGAANRAPKPPNAPKPKKNPTPRDVSLPESFANRCCVAPDPEEAARRRLPAVGKITV